MEARFYCPKHYTPVDFSPELEGYTCGMGCEKVFQRDELVLEADLLKTQESVAVTRFTRRPMGEFL